MTFLEKLDYLMENNKLNKKKLSNTSGIAYTTIVNWYSRGYGNMSVSIFKELCDFFGVTMDSMAYDDKEIEYVSDIGKQNKLSMDEKKLLSDYKELNEIGKARLLERSQMLIEDGYVEEKGESNVG